MSWLGELSKMYDDLFAEFGEQILIDNIEAIAIPAESLEEFSMMQANVTRICISKAAGVKVKKGSVVDYRGKTFKVSDVPEHSEELIYFNLA